MSINGEIAHRLTSVGNALSGPFAGVTPWTTNIKTTLVELGKAKGYKTCASGCSGLSDWGEWMFDVCWLDYDWPDSPADRLLKAVPLIAECEWGGLESVVDDFEKLLVGAADLRLMIFDGFNHADIHRIFGVLRRMADHSSCTREKDQFMLAGYDNDTRRFLFFSFESKCL